MRRTAANVVSFSFRFLTDVLTARRLHCQRDGCPGGFVGDPVAGLRHGLPTVCRLALKRCYGAGLRIRRGKGPKVKAVCPGEAFHDAGDPVRMPEWKS